MGFAGTDVTGLEHGEMTEKARDWYAQDKHVNVWCFGELVEKYEDGAFTDNSGSWEAGVDGALPGLFMLANPIVGLWYRQECRPGEAEDVAQIREIGVSVTVAAGTYDNCIMIAKWNPLERGILENDDYAPGVGSIREVGVRGESDFVDLNETR